MRIERHRIDEAALATAEADFAERITGDVHRMQEDPRPAAGWRVVADTFLDYLGARSVRLPELHGKDAEAALGSAAAAAVGALELTLVPRRQFGVFIDYTGAGVSYGGEFDSPEEREGKPEARHGRIASGRPSSGQGSGRPLGQQGRQNDDASGWLDALHLAFLARASDRAAEVFIEAAPPWRGNEGRADVALVHALMAYVFGHEEGPDDFFFPVRPDHMFAGRPDDVFAGRSDDILAVGPVQDVEKCALIDMVVATLGEGDDWPGHRAALSTLRALAAGDEEGFHRRLATQLEQYRSRVGAGDAPPRSLLPLDALALMAMAHRRQGWATRIESGYLPRALVTGFAPEAPRVRAYGSDKRADAMAALATGPLVVGRPAHPFAVQRLDPSPYDDCAAHEMARFHDLREDPKALARDLMSLMSDQRQRFLARAALDPQGVDPGRDEALVLGAEAGAGALRVARAEPGTEVEVTVGGTTRRLPAWRGTFRPNPHQWQQAVALALVIGARGPLADCVLIEPGFFAEGDHPSPGGAYCAALHDYLRGVDPEPAMDHALLIADRADTGGFLAPPAALLSQLVQGDRQGFALALADALEEHREHYTVGARGKDMEAAINLDVLGLVCHAHRLGWPVPVSSPYLPQGLLI
ncbi:immunity 49 family protein [Streptomyces sp. ASQP_92]|uniref:immunity 49 family protein n=1 Tax=Streptomyces sp. ASQP_92 TaxID=2979116 RepID=UPI0021BFD569|nr:immunity 49 family protein [Streptomyces sp. ASQP_92]MCT9088996.1 immunity 49 family protein [Streptomyces sp. ASQP_92]